MELWKKILTETMKSYQARLDEAGKPYNNVANFGLDIGQISYVRRNGEYHNFRVKALEVIKPLLTHHRIARAVKALSTNDIHTAISILTINEEVKQYGINLLYTILHNWLKRVGFDIYPEYEHKATIKLPQKIIDWINTDIHAELKGKLEVVGIGSSLKGNSVVPESWLGKIFESGIKLHSEMNTLDWRKGKPVVRFCAVYGMSILDIHTWTSYNDDILGYSPQIGFMIAYDGVKMKTRYCKFSTNLDYIKWAQGKKLKKFLLHDLSDATQIIICADYDNIVDKYSKYSACESIGVLVSRLQKCIRRGIGCNKLIDGIVTNLAYARPYNMPDLQFLKVSGSRQLLWRLFITTFEDSTPYRSAGNKECLGLDNIFGLAMLTQADPSIVLQSCIVKMIIKTALHIQANTTYWNWRVGKVIDVPNKYNTKDELLDTISIALRTMPMMKADKRLMAMSYDIIKNKKIKIDKLPKLPSELDTHNDDKIIEVAILSSFDMHCIPSIIIELQASIRNLPHKKYMTKSISSLIWELSSKINVRYTSQYKKTTDDDIVLNELRQIQRYYWKKNYESNVKIANFVIKNAKVDIIESDDVPNYLSRLAFLIMFGKKVRFSNPSREVIVAGTKDQICKVKKPSKDQYSYLSGKEREKGEQRYIEYMNKKNKHRMVLDNPPIGFKWKHKIIDVYVENDKKNIYFHANKIKMKPFDGKDMLEKLPNVVDVELPKDYVDIVRPLFYDYQMNFDESIYVLNRLARDISGARKKAGDNRTFDWEVYSDRIPSVVWKHMLAKIYNSYNDVVQIGPVDRQGKKVNESISYVYEGSLWRLFNVMAMLYPRVIIPSGTLRFKIRKDKLEYISFLNKISNLAFANDDAHITLTLPKIKTKLWDHQKQTSNRIVHGFTIEQRNGFGDASHVGAGKTLTALSAITKLMKYNVDNKIKQYKGSLILLPTTKLYLTWTNEIIKHTAGFDIIIQNHDGILMRDGKKIPVDGIRFNTIVITTLGRMRDHPFYVSWLVVIIDECLSVQNKEALQTEEAWRQVICSQYGCVLMSATFFRSRFDKMFYMLKMLRSGLPEIKEYLDTILSECMICNIPENTRIWKTNTTRYILNDTVRNKYEQIKQKNIASDKLYNLLEALLYKYVDYVEIFTDKIKQLKNHRILIYARSKAEADLIANGIDCVTRYPDKSGDHVVVSYAEGTFGLNDLVIYDVILTRPPQPDKLPQMKGRLDRPGQEKELLRLEYVLIKDTIEEAWLIRLEMANTFYKNHIMPLADFYDIAIGKNNTK
jgi:hypothetical protein